MPPDSQLQANVLPGRYAKPGCNKLFAFRRRNLADKFTFEGTHLDCPLGLGTSQEVSLQLISHPGTPVSGQFSMHINRRNQLVEPAPARVEEPATLDALGEHVVPDCHVTMAG